MNTGAAGGHFVRNPDGSAFVGKVWPGPSVFPDFTQQSTRQWWGTLYNTFASDGLTGFWNDMNEPRSSTPPTRPSPTMPSTLLTSPASSVGRQPS